MVRRHCRREVRG